MQDPFLGELRKHLSTRTANAVFNDRDYLGISTVDDLRKRLREDVKIPAQLLRIPGLGRKSADELYQWANGRKLFGPNPDLRRKRRQQVLAKRAEALRGIIARSEEKTEEWRAELKELESLLD